MTHFNGGQRPAQQHQRAMPRWLAFAFTVVAFSVPVAGILMLVWPVLLQRTSLVGDGVELICLAVATVLIAGALASHVHRDRGQRL
ncbi:hypothetical protein ACU4GR_33625 (plasmid) [Methylobacterium oryzae CBMB20]